MDIGACMQQMADRLGTITGLRAVGYPASQVSPPAAIVSYPNSIDYDKTYRRGQDAVEIPVVVVIGKTADRTTRDALAAYSAGAGASSIKTVLESGTYTAFETIRVASADFDVVTIAGVDYMAGVFTCEITGIGA
jgi:hypothetical protein